MLNRPAQARSRDAPHFLSHDYKLARAYEHMRALDTAIDRWLETRPHMTTTERAPDTGQQVVYVEPSKTSPPPCLSLILSDAIQNMRSALDHLVYALAYANLKGVVPDKIAKDIAFPIYGDRELPKNEAKRRLGAIHPAAKAFIEKLQPHGKPQNSPWWELSNVNKHRRSFTIGGPGHDAPETFQTYTGPIEHRTEVLRYALHPQAKVDVEISPSFGIGVADFSLPGPLLQQLAFIWHLPALGHIGSAACHLNVADDIRKDFYHRIVSGVRPVEAENGRYLV